MKNANETISKTSGTVSHNHTFQYDMRSQLTSATITNIGGNNWTATYNYHENGDIGSKIIQGSQTDFTYVGNQMDTASGGDSFNLDWDLNGQMNNLPYSGITTQLVWNWDGKLQSATKDPNSISLKYDPMGNRVFKGSTVNGNRKYVVDIAGGLRTILLEINSTNGSILKTYVYANSQILMQHDGTPATNNKYFYQHDRLGSVRQVINQNGLVEKYYTFEPFGKTLEEGGTLTNSFLFTGQYFDSEINEYYLRARQYDPHIGRFTSRDSVQGQFQEPLTLHRYLYCQNEPVNRIDPWGLYYELPGAGSEYNEEETQTILDLATEIVGTNFIVGPYVAFVWNPWFGPHGMFDYKGSDLTFMRAGAKLTGSEFGNYLAGYTTFYNYDIAGELFTRAGGDFYEFLNYGNEWYRDDPSSRFYITAGALHALRDKYSGGLWKQLNEIRLGYSLYNNMIDYDTSDVEGADNAIAYGHLFWWNYGE